MPPPTAEEWVKQLEGILTDIYLPHIMEMVEIKLYPLVRETMLELHPQILRMVQEEVRLQINREVVKRIRIVIEE